MHMNRIETNASSQKNHIFHALKSFRPVDVMCHWNHSDRWMLCVGRSDWLPRTSILLQVITCFGARGGPVYYKFVQQTKFFLIINMCAVWSPPDAPSWQRREMKYIPTVLWKVWRPSIPPADTSTHFPITISQSTSEPPPWEMLFSSKPQAMVCHAPPPTNPSTNQPINQSTHQIIPNTVN